MKLATDRNPNGMPKDLQYCVYYHPSNPLFYSLLGHSDCRNKVYAMNAKIKDKRKEGLDSIKSENMAAEAERITREGK